MTNVFYRDTVTSGNIFLSFPFFPHTLLILKEKKFQFYPRTAVWTEVNICHKVTVQNTTCVYVSRNSKQSDKLRLWLYFIVFHTAIKSTTQLYPKYFVQCCCVCIYRKNYIFCILRQDCSKKCFLLNVDRRFWRPFTGKHVQVVQQLNNEHALINQNNLLGDPQFVNDLLNARCEILFVNRFNWLGAN